QRIVLVVILEAFALLGRAALFIIFVGFGLFLDLILVLERDAGSLLADFAVVLFLILEAFRSGILGQHRFQINDLAQLHVAIVERVRPFDDRVKGQRAFAKAKDHRVTAGFDALCNRDLALAAQ